MAGRRGEKGHLRPRWRSRSRCGAGGPNHTTPLPRRLGWGNLSPPLSSSRVPGLAPSHLWKLARREAAGTPSSLPPTPCVQAVADWPQERCPSPRLRGGSRAARGGRRANGLREPLPTPCSLRPAGRLSCDSGRAGAEGAEGTSAKDRSQPCGERGAAAPAAAATAAATEPAARAGLAGRAPRRGERGARSWSTRTPTS